ncbi:MAG: response regulator transcription factor [Dehalococcoidia bacterium]
MERVLVVDDDPAIGAALERGLRLEGFTVHVAPGGLLALDDVRDVLPDVVVLDLGLPDIDGIEVVRRLRGEGHSMPVCILSARDEVADRVGGLEAGADDYLVKPFALEELVARLRALLRRGAPATAGPDVEVDGLRLDPARRQAFIGERELVLTRREFDLLMALARHPGRVLSREQLLSTVWGYDFAVDSNVVDVFIGYLRRKLEAGGEPRLIHTVRGVGFVVRA